MPVIDCEQGTVEWKQLRAGNVTASRVADVLAKIKTGEAAVRRNYKAQLVAEILTGMPQDNGYVSADMQRGTELEPLARAAYEISREVMVEQVGFVLHPVIQHAGASPDGLVGDEGLIEIKCPKTATHLQYLLDAKPPADYQPQMTWQMACTGRKWVDFVSYDPTLPERYALFVVRFDRDEKRIQELEAEVIRFNLEVENILHQLAHKGSE